MARSAKPKTTPPFVLMATAFAAVLVLVAGVLIGIAFRDRTQGVAGSPLGAAIGGKFSLVDQNGKPFTDSDLKGKWQLVFFGYTHCPDVCPTALNDLIGGQIPLSFNNGPESVGQIAGGTVRALAVTTAPAADTASISRLENMFLSCPELNGMRER